jgi:hypothetical protein
VDYGDCVGGVDLRLEGGTGLDRRFERVAEAIKILHHKEYRGRGKISFSYVQPSCQKAWETFFPYA